MSDQQQTNLWDFLNNLTDKIFSLLSTGNIVGVILIGVLSIFALVLWRLPAEEISPFILKIIEILQKKYFASLILAVTNVFTLSSCLSQRKKYKKEINRLAEIRSKIIHGREHENWKTIPEHKSSNFQLDKDD